MNVNSAIIYISFTWISNFIIGAIPYFQWSLTLSKNQKRFVLIVSWIIILRYQHRSVTLNSPHIQSHHSIQLFPPSEFVMSNEKSNFVILGCAWSGKRSSIYKISFNEKSFDCASTNNCQKQRVSQGKLNAVRIYQEKWWDVSYMHIEECVWYWIKKIMIKVFVIDFL